MAKAESGAWAGPKKAKEPKKPMQADNGEPSKISEFVRRKVTKDPAKPGSVTVAPASAGEEQPADGQEQEKKEQEQHWLGIRLTDEEGNPVPNERYEVTLPDGSKVDGTLNEKGEARLEGVDPGTAKVDFPNLHDDEWKPA